jgi:hypothetical protein
MVLKGVSKFFLKRKGPGRKFEHINFLAKQGPQELWVNLQSRHQQDNK